MTEHNALELSYTSAWRNYQRQWRLIDEILLRIFRDHPGHDWEDVYPKVVFIDSVYRASLSRSLKQTPADQHVAEALSEDADVVAPAIEAMQLHREFSEASLSDTLRAHAVILESVRSRLGAKSVRSFASKYLHFHAPNVVPILDSLAYEHIRRYQVDEHLRLSSFALRPKLLALGGFDPEYLDFSLRFLALFQQLQSLEAVESVSIKVLDHMLWLG